MGLNLPINTDTSGYSASWRKRVRLLAGAGAAPPSNAVTINGVPVTVNGEVLTIT